MMCKKSRREAKGLCWVDADVLKFNISDTKNYPYLIWVGIQ